MSAHSPGPWEYDGDSYIVSPKADVAVASLLAIPSPLFTVRGAWDQEQALANARLIAAAPELLEALKLMDKYIASLVEAHVCGNSISDVIVAHKGVVTTARAAISKAAGK